MLSANASGKVREALGVFPNFLSLEEAMDELGSEGFDRAQCSLMADPCKVEDVLGHEYQSVKDLVDNPHVPRRSYVPLEAIGDGEGALLAIPSYLGAVVPFAIVTAYGAGLTASLSAVVFGGIVGFLFGRFFAKRFFDKYCLYLKRQLNRGGIVLWVRAWNKKDEEKACDILRKHDARHVKVHSVQAV